jgi:hypothetical protein
VGYSALHALVSWVLCHLIGTELGVAPEEREALVYAALTMNIGMTDCRMNWRSNWSAQCAADGGHSHPRQPWASSLAELAVTNPLWLETIALHDDESTGQASFAACRRPGAWRACCVWSIATQP